MTIFIWDPRQGYAKGTSKHIATQGFHPSRHPLTVSTQGFILPDYANIDILMGGEANTSLQSPSIYTGEGIIIVDGANAPVSTVLNDVRVYEYEPFGNIDLGGDAPFIIDINGNIVYDYSAIGADGPDLGGDGDTIYIPGTGIVPEHGGRGVLRPATKPRTFKKAPHIWIWKAPLLRKFSLNPGGSADTEFVKGHKFPFVSELPQYDPPKEEDHLELFKTINDYVKRQATLPTEYEYTGKGSKELAFDTKSDYEFQSPIKEQRFAEDELVLTLALDTEPLIIVTTDSNINKIRKDDEFILNLLDF